MGLPVSVGTGSFKLLYKYPFNQIMKKNRIIDDRNCNLSLRV